MFTHSNQKQIKLKTHHKSNFVANGRNALAKVSSSLSFVGLTLDRKLTLPLLFLPSRSQSAYRYGFRNVQNGFICAPDGPRSKVLQLKAPGDLTDATEVPTTNIALGTFSFPQLLRPNWLTPSLIFRPRVHCPCHVRHFLPLSYTVGFLLF